MSRLARNLFTFCSAASLVLCVAACGLWVRSYRVADHLTREDANYDICRFRSSNGVLRAGWESPFCKAYPHDRVNEWVYFPRPAPRGRRLAKIVLPVDFGVTFRDRDRAIWLPYWALVSVLALPPLARWWPVRARRDGLCPACGYDLRATPGRCPECGAVPSN